MPILGATRLSAKRIYDRLRDEHGFDGGYMTVKDYVRGARVRVREMFVPLLHPPGHAQVDFGEAFGIIGGIKRKVHFFCLDLPHSDACFVKAYPAETTEAFLDGHVSAFRFFGGVPIVVEIWQERLDARHTWMNIAIDGALEHVAHAMSPPPRPF